MIKNVKNRYTNGIPDSLSDGSDGWDRSHSASYYERPLQEVIRMSRDLSNLSLFPSFMVVYLYFLHYISEAFCGVSWVRKALSVWRTLQAIYLVGFDRGLVKSTPRPSFATGSIRFYKL